MSEKHGDPHHEAFDGSSWLHPRAREVYRDDVLWVIDKPAGVLSHPNPRPAARSSVAAKGSNVLLRAPYDTQREIYRLRPRDGRERHVWLIHRLDLETSGLILCAFDGEAASALQEALYRREVEKEYRALLVGEPRGDAGEWSDRLEKVSRSRRAEVRVVAGRPNAETAWRVVRRFPGAGLTLASLSPKTGRTHQLRVQAASRGLPIAGDDRYGDFTANRFLGEKAGLRRMFLHASRLVLRHPRRGRRLTFTSELSSPLAAPLERLAELEVRVPRREPEKRRKRGRRRGSASRGR